MKPTAFIILMEVCIVYWWVCLGYSRGKAAEVRAKYAVWDNAYKNAIKSGKSQYQATMEAINAVNAGKNALKAWDAAYDKATGSGMGKYRAGMKAAAAAREAAHRNR